MWVSERLAKADASAAFTAPSDDDRLALQTLFHQKVTQQLGVDNEGRAAGNHVVLSCWPALGSTYQQPPGEDLVGASFS